MPSLPRIKRTGSRGRAEVVARPEQQPRLSELHAEDLTWVHLDSPMAVEAAALAERFGWHELDLEDDMFEGRSEEVVRDSSIVKQEIISYRKIIKPERSTLRLLERHTERFLPEALELYFDDIVDAAERIWDLLDNFKEVVEALEATNESVISHKQNDVLRILTVFSVILLPLTLITGVFGMNVRFPGFETETAWWAILVAMLAALGALLGFFRWKRWL